VREAVVPCHWLVEVYQERPVERTAQSEFDSLVCDRLVVRPTQLLSQPNFEAWCRPIQESANFEGQEPLLRINNIHRQRCG
jgi:hypothetical protein